MASYIWPPTAGGVGTVTSVALTAPSSILTVSGSPITSNGTLALSLTTQNANTVWAGPTSGSAANPTFRALVTADLPLTFGNLTDVGTDGITIGNGTGAVIGSGTTISQHVAGTSNNGYLSSTDWNTFNGKQAALTFGNLTDTGTDGITVGNGTGAVIGTGTTISQHVAGASNNGYLASTDWSTFNGKVGTISVASSNGFAGTSSGGSTPSLTLSTTITGILQGNGTAISAATTGNFTDSSSGADGILVSGGTGAVLGSGTSIAQQVANTSQNGYLSSTDWNTFNTQATTVAVTAGIQIPTGTLNGSYNVVIFGTVLHDTNSAYNTSTGTYTVPVAGWYSIYGQLEIANTSYSLNDNVQIAIYVNGVLAVAGGLFATLGIDAVTVKASHASLFSVNDTIAFASFFSVTSGTGSYVQSTAGSNFWIMRR